MKLKILTGLALCAGIAHGGGPDSLVLDDFDSVGGDDAAGVRVISSSIFDPFSQGGEFYIDAGFSSGSDTGALFFNSGIGAQQSGDLEYAPSGLDLSAYNALEMDFLGADQSFEIWLVLIGNDGGKAVGAFQIDAGVNQTATFAFGDFDTFGFDWSDIDSIDVTFNNGDRVSALDFVATEFRAVVPAPGTLAMLGLGGLAATRRRR